VGSGGSLSLSGGAGETGSSSGGTVSVSGGKSVGGEAGSVIMEGGRVQVDQADLC